MIVLTHPSLELREPRQQLGLADDPSRNLRNARTTKMLIWTARRLLRTVAAMSAPCSVKASGAYLTWAPLFKVTDCDLERRIAVMSSLLRRNAKSGGNRSALRLTA